MLATDRKNAMKNSYSIFRRPDGDFVRLQRQIIGKVVDKIILSEIYHFGYNGIGFD
jgi:hypothetical protein